MQFPEISQKTGITLLLIAALVLMADIALGLYLAHACQ